eukprot:372477-Rhodomonas_salina.1
MDIPASKECLLNGGTSKPVPASGCWTIHHLMMPVGTQPGDLDQRHTKKAQASVEHVTFVMTISGSIPATMWDTNFSLFKLGVGEPKRKQALR